MIGFLDVAWILASLRFNQYLTSSNISCVTATVCAIYVTIVEQLLINLQPYAQMLQDNALTLALAGKQNKKNVT